MATGRFHPRHLGGWQDPQTVLKCYQRPDETTMREALASRKALVIGAEF